MSRQAFGRSLVVGKCNRYTRGMASEEIYQAAKLLIQDYGADAQAHAAMQSQARMDVGDSAGYKRWQMIGRALMKIKVADGRRPH